MKNFVKILGIILLIAGSALSVFTAIPLADYIGIGVAALGLAFLIGSTLKKVEKKTWKEYLAVILFAVAGFCLGFVGFTQELFTQIATGIAGIVALIAGLLIPTLAAKK